MLMRILLLLFFISSVCFAQQTVKDTIVHDGLERAYILYVPANYSEAAAAPLVINFHGHTSNSQEQMFYGDFTKIAEAEGFIVVHPMGTLDFQNEPYWNAGFGGAVDDVGFTESLIDSLSAQYNIDQARVYSTGMSNGGYMSYTLACELSNRIAAIASVTGSMTTAQLNSCSPSRAVPVMEIHGTADPTVLYEGKGFSESIPDVIDYWVDFNNCSAEPVITQVPNYNTNDGCTATHYVYKAGDDGVEVEHYKIVDGAHTWPGAPINIGVTNRDIDASEKIWEFFNKYDMNGRRIGLGINQSETILKDVSVYPNPATNFVAITWNAVEVESISVVNAVGAEVGFYSITSQNSLTLATEDWGKGLYLIEGRTKQNDRFVTRFLVN
ncbi:T9SS type A sorting domain-containing protein [Bacteroidota bacterium]